MFIFNLNREDWSKYKADAPFGQVPWLEICDGSKITRLPQSVSIGKRIYFLNYFNIHLGYFNCLKIQARYLSRKFNLAGSTDEEQAESDA